MNRRHLFVLTLVLLAGVAVILGGVLVLGHQKASAATASSATLTIRHQVQHCHAWSLNGGAYKAAQNVSMSRGSTIKVIDNDVMSHRLIQFSGSRVTMHNGTGGSMHKPAAPGAMNYPGASTTIKFGKPGVYRFRTKAGEDYMAGIKTTGEDNVLTLTVKVR